MEARKIQRRRAHRILVVSPLALLGGILAIISSFIAWGPSDSSFDVPLQFLWGEHGPGRATLGVPLVSVAGAVGLLSTLALEPIVFLRRLAGIALLGATALYVVQLGREIGWDNLTTDNIKAGPYLAGVGGLLALLAPTGLWPFRRRRPPVPA